MTGPMDIGNEFPKFVCTGSIPVPVIFARFVQWQDTIPVKL